MEMYIIDKTTGEIMFSFDATSAIQTYTAALIIIDKYSDSKYELVSPSGSTANAATVALNIILDRQRA